MSQSAGDPSKQSGRLRIDTVLAALVLASCFVVPLVFALGQRDAFALTKIIALQVIAAVAILVAVTRCVLQRNCPGISTSATDVAVLALIGQNLVACIVSIDPLRSLIGEDLQYQGFVSVVLYVSFFYVSYASFGDERRLALLFGSVAAGATLVAVYAVAQTARLDPIWDFPHFGRTFSTIGQPNGLAAYLVVAAPVSVALLPRMQATRSRALVILVVGLMGAALLSSKSRGGYIGALISAVILARPLAQTLRLRARNVVTGLALLIVGAAVAAPARETMTLAWQRSVSSTDLSEWSIRRHLDLWAVATAIALDHPLFGTGQETFPDVFPQYARATLGSVGARAFNRFRVESPHNVYLAIAAGAGFPALVAYLSLIGGVVFTVAGRLRTCRGDWRRLGLAAVLAAIAGHLVTDTFMTAEVTSSWLFWVLMGAGLRIAREVRASNTLDAGGPSSAH